MQFTRGSLPRAQSPMEVELRLDKEDPIYTHGDTVSGEVILRTDSPTNLSTIVLSLSGMATSRLTRSKHTETHKLFKRTQLLFPTNTLLKDSHSSSVTIGEGNHSLRFSISFPQATECHKASLFSGRSQVSCIGLGCWRKEKSHLLTNSPPSTEESDSLAEIRYSLKVTVVGKCTSIKTQSLSFFPCSDLIPQQRPFKQKCLIHTSPQIVETHPSSFFRITTELQHGHCLLLDRPIPLQITITMLGDLLCNILLNGFQTMLIETTVVKARGKTESSTRTWIVQSTANMNHPIPLTDTSPDSTLCLEDTIWASNRLPSGLTSSFRVCNIERSYKLNIKLVFLVGNHQLRTVIREFEYPVSVMGAISSLEKSSP